MDINTVLLIGVMLSPLYTDLFCFMIQCPLHIHIHQPSVLTRTTHYCQFHTHVRKCTFLIDSSVDMKNIETKRPALLMNDSDMAYPSQ